MTKEEKQLLLKDLCARLPYKIKVKYLYWDEDKGCEYPTAMILDDINSDGYIRFHGDIKKGEGRGVITQYLPYLRPMSSMTDEERKEFDKIIKSCNNKVFACPEQERRYVFFDAEQEDFMNAHQFDYRGLIEKGLALEAPEGMYKTE